MYIRSVYIESFAALKNRELQFSRGLNVIEGTNESGKSSVCMFIKFMLYGLSGRGSEGELSERQKYVSWDSGRCAGKMVIVSSKGEFLIERELSLSQNVQGQTEARERLFVTDLASGERVFKGQNPGVCILGIDEQMFVNTVFVRQIGGGRIDGDGMAEAIENLLLTGDEGVSVRRAVERLEKSRKALMHKRGAGGKIQLLLQEEARLSLKLEESRKGNSAIISHENESARLDSLINTRTREKEENEAYLAAYEKIEAGRRVEKALALAGKIKELTGKLSELDRYGSISDGVGRINSLSANLSGVESRLKGLRRSLGDEPEAADRMTEEDILASKNEALQAKKLRKAKTLPTVLGALCTALGVMALAGAAFLWYFGGAYLVPGAAGAALVLLGIALLVIGLINAKKLSGIYKKWGAEDVDSLEAAINGRIVRARLYDKADGERKRREAEIAECDRERDHVLSLLREACRIFVEDEMPDTDLLVARALEAAREISVERDGLRAELGLARGELRGYSDVLRTDGGAGVKRSADAVLLTDAGKRAHSFTPKDAAFAKSKKNFAESALPGLLRQKGDVDSALARLRATTHDSAVLAAQLDGIRREIGDMKTRLEGIEAATQALVRAGEGLRSSLMPNVVREAGRLILDFTDGKYSAVDVNRDFELDFILDGKKRDLSYMSAGTADAAYISLRCALVRVLFSGDAPPLVYDESFARIDEGRLVNILELLCKGDGGQSLVFTCRSLERELAGGLPGASVIKL